jgi:hypothetical protein
MAGQPLYIEDILAALRERRIGAETAVNWLEMRAADQRRQARQVQAHSNAAVRDLVVKAVDAALAGDGGDEFSQLFPPHDPLGPELGHEEYPGRSLIYEGDNQGQRHRQPRTTASAPLSDDDLYAALFPPEHKLHAAEGWD